MCDCDIPTTDHLVCVEDFCGMCRHSKPVGYSHHISFWAHYDPVAKVTHFGGTWSSVPDLVSATQPTDSEVRAHATDCCNWKGE